MTNFNSVKKFMEVFGQEVKTKAEYPSEKIADLRGDNFSLVAEQSTSNARRLFGLP